MEKIELELKFSDFQARDLFQCGCLDLDHKNILLLSPNGDSRKLHSLLAQTSVLLDVTDISREVSAHRGGWKRVDREAESWLKCQARHLPFMRL